MKTVKSWLRKHGFDYLTAPSAESRCSYIVSELSLWHVPETVHTPETWALLDYDADEGALRLVVIEKYQIP